MLALIKAVGGLIAIAVYLTILTNRLATTLPVMVGKAAVVAGLPVAEVPVLLAAALKGTLIEVPRITIAIITAIT